MTWMLRAKDWGGFHSTSGHTLYGTCGLRRRPRCCSMDHKTEGIDIIPAGTEPIPSERIGSFPSPPRRDGHQDDFSQGFFGVAVLNAGPLSTP